MIISHIKMVYDAWRNVIDASKSVIDDSRVTFQIVASLTGNSRGIFYDHDIFIV